MGRMHAGGGGARLVRGVGGGGSRSPPPPSQTCEVINEIVFADSLSLLLSLDCYTSFVVAKEDEMKTQTWYSSKH